MLLLYSICQLSQLVDNFICLLFAAPVEKEAAFFKVSDCLFELHFEGPSGFLDQLDVELGRATRSHPRRLQTHQATPMSEVGTGWADGIYSASGTASPRAVDSGSVLPGERRLLWLF